MSIKAARATRKFVVGLDGTPVESFGDTTPAQAACDRLNLAAVLEVIKTGDVIEVWQERLALAGQATSRVDAVTCCEIFDAMIDALLAETKETTDA